MLGTFFDSFFSEVLFLLRVIKKDCVHIFHHNLVQNCRVHIRISFAFASVAKKSLRVTDQITGFVRDNGNFVVGLQCHNTFVNHIEAVTHVVSLINDLVLNKLSLLCERNGRPNELLVLLLVLAQKPNFVNHLTKRFDHN